MKSRIIAGSAIGAVALAALAAPLGASAATAAPAQLSVLHGIPGVPVDVSVEPLDGDPQHSGDTIVRGTLGS